MLARGGCVLLLGISVLLLGILVAIIIRSQRVAAVLVGTGALLIGVVLFVLVAMSGPRDRCLDDGGRWNEELKRCEGCRSCPPLPDSAKVESEPKP